MKKNLDALSKLHIMLIGISAFALMLWITPNGSGVSPDSTVYLETAKSLLLGKGLFAFGNPVTHYPPLYPIFLAATNLFEDNLVQAARFLNALIFGINVVLVGWMTYLTTAHDFLATISATFVFLFSAPLVMLHSMAWSEPLFLSFSIAGIILLSMYVSKSSLTFLIVSSVFFGFAMITRYIGVAFLPAAVIIILRGWDNQRVSFRIRNAFIWLVSACAPLVILLVRNMIGVGSATNRNFVFHPISISHLKAYIDVLYVFLVPIGVPNWTKAIAISLIFVLLTLGLIIIFNQQFKDKSRHSLSIVLTISNFLFSATYSLFLFVSISLFDAYTPIDSRLLSPVFVFLIVGIIGLTWNLAKILKKPALLRWLLLSVTLTLLINIPYATLSAADIRKNGRGYTSRLWQNSESIGFIKSLSRDLKIYSNGSDVIGFLGEKRSLTIPEKISTDTLEANYQYNEEFKAMCKDIKENRAILMYFNAIDWRWYLPTQVEIQATCHLPVMYHFRDGTVYGKIFE